MGGLGRGLRPKIGCVNNANANGSSVAEQPSVGKFPSRRITPSTDSQLHLHNCQLESICCMLLWSWISSTKRFPRTVCSFLCACVSRFSLSH